MLSDSCLTGTFRVGIGESIGYIVSILSVGIQYQYLLQYLVFPWVLNQYFRRTAVSESSILAEFWQFWANFGRFSLFLR